MARPTSPLRPVVAALEARRDGIGTQMSALSAEALALQSAARGALAGALETSADFRVAEAYRTASLARAEHLTDQSGDLADHHRAAAVAVLKVQALVKAQEAALKKQRAARARWGR